MEHSAREYVESSSGRTGLYELLFSRANTFRLSDAPEKRLSVRVAALDIPSASIIRVASSGHEIDLVDDDLTTIMLPLAGTVSVGSGENRFEAPAGRSLTFLPSARRTFVSPPAKGLFQALMLKMPSRQPGGPALLARGGTPLVSTSAAAMASLRDLLAYVMTDLSSAAPVLIRPQASRSLDVLIQEQFRALFPQAEPGRTLSRISAMKVYAAEEYMRANFTEPLTIAEIARACGIGVRNLQSSFRLATGQSPRARLATIRLEGAYMELISGTERSVTEVAMNCGFVHLGRFAQAYSRQFGELPSQTLRRGRSGTPN